MAARSEDPLAYKRVDGHPIVQLSLLDKVLLRKYSHHVPSGGLSTSDCWHAAQNKREGLSKESEGPQSSREIVQAIVTDGGATGRQEEEEAFYTKSSKVH